MELGSDEGEVILSHLERLDAAVLGGTLRLLLVSSSPVCASG